MRALNRFKQQHLTSFNLLPMQVTAYFIKPETSGRGGLHLHSPIAMPYLQPDHLTKHLADADANAGVLSRIERLMCGTLPDGWSLVDRGSTYNTEPPPDVEVETFPSKLLANACQPPLDGSLPKHELDAHVTRSIAGNNMHRHTQRCRKNKHAGTDLDCALCWPRGLVPDTAVTDQSIVLVKHTVPNLVFYARAVMLGIACNHTIYCFVELSRWKYEHDRHMQRVSEGRAKACDAPLPPTIVQAALEASFYSTKYCTKGDNLDLSAEFFRRLIQRHEKVRFQYINFAAQSNQTNLQSRFSSHHVQTHTHIHPIQLPLVGFGRGRPTRRLPTGRERPPLCATIHEQAAWRDHIFRPTVRLLPDGVQRPRGQLFDGPISPLGVCAAAPPGRWWHTRWKHNVHVRQLVLWPALGERARPLSPPRRAPCTTVTMAVCHVVRGRAGRRNLPSASMCE